MKNIFNPSELSEQQRSDLYFPKPDELKVPIAASLRFLESESQGGAYNCYLSKQRDAKSETLSPRELGTPLFVLATCHNRGLSEGTTNAIVDYCIANIVDGRMNYFEKRGAIPDDVDTTAFGLSLLSEMGRVDLELARRSAKTVTENVDNDGLIKVYFSDQKDTLDHVTATNALYFANLFGLRDATTKTENWVADMLLSGEYLKGSRYYEPPEAFLYFLSRAASRFPSLGARVAKPLIEALRKRVDRIGPLPLEHQYPIDSAMRVTTFRNMGLVNNFDRDNLLEMARPDGSWPTDSFFKYGDKQVYFGSPAMSTAFAVEALAPLQRT